LPEGPALSREAEGTFRRAEVVQGARSASLLFCIWVMLWDGMNVMDNIRTAVSRKSEIRQLLRR
jgi:hypothetical protein